MGGMMAPVYLILGAIALVLSIPVLVAVIGLITMFGNAIGLGG
jgi:hypothetical protein